MEVLKEKLNKSFDFNPITCLYHDKEKEERIRTNEMKSFMERGARRQKSQPPSLREREEIIMDMNKKPPPSVQAHDKRKEASKTRYKLNAESEEQVKANRMVEEARLALKAGNRMNGRKYIQNYAKGKPNSNEIYRFWRLGGNRLRHRDE